MTNFVTYMYSCNHNNDIPNKNKIGWPLETGLDTGVSFAVEEQGARGHNILKTYHVTYYVTELWKFFTDIWK